MEYFFWHFTSFTFDIHMYIFFMANKLYCCCCYSRVSFLNDLDLLNEIFNDMKHCAVSLRQLSFLVWVGALK